MNNNSFLMRIHCLYIFVPSMVNRLFFANCDLVLCSRLCEMTTLYPTSDLFDGCFDKICAASCIHRFNRIALAISQFLCGDVKDTVRQRRWRIGLLYEVVSSKLTIIS